MKVGLAITAEYSFAILHGVYSEFKNFLKTNKEFKNIFGTSKETESH